MKIRLKPQAENDLKKIYNYSYYHFGKRKAVQYIKEINKAFLSIQFNSSIALKCDYIKPSLLKYVVNSHVLFLKSNKNEIVIIRILHQSQDYQRHV